MHCIHILSILLAVVSIAGPSSALAVSDSKLTDQQLRQRGNEYLLNNGNPDSAIACWQAILRRPHDNSPQQRQQLAMAHNNMGYVYMFYRYDYTLAIKHLLEAQQLAPQSDATILLNLGMATNFYAQCFPTDENISNSCTFLTASLRKAIQQDKHTIAYSAFANLWTFGFTPFALSTASEAMALFAKIKPQRDNNEWRYAACLWHAAQSMQQGHPQEALEWLRRQLRCVNAENPQRDSCYTYCLMAQVLAAINCPPRDIIAYADKVRDMALRHGMKDYEKDAAQMLADCYFRCGDTITAHRYELEYFKRRDSLLLRSGLAKVQTGYLSHHLDLASRQVEELQQKRRVQTAVLITSLCGIGVAAVLVVLLFPLLPPYGMELQVGFGRFQPKYTQTPTASCTAFTFFPSCWPSFPLPDHPVRLPCQTANSPTNSCANEATNTCSTMAIPTVPLPVGKPSCDGRTTIRHSNASN